MKFDFLYQRSISLLFAMLSIILSVSPANAQVHAQYYDVQPNPGACTPGVLTRIIHKISKTVGG